MRLIDADELIAYIDCGHLRSQNELCFSDSSVVDMINRMPTFGIRTLLGLFQRTFLIRYIAELFVRVRRKGGDGSAD